MFLTLLMFFLPEAGWSRAAEASRNPARLILIHMLPLILIGCAAEAFGMLKWGKLVGKFNIARICTQEQTLQYQACQFAAALVTIMLCAAVIRILGNTFHIRQKFMQALTLSVFGLGPVFLMRLCDAFPAINPWLSWGIGAVFTAAILYQGGPRVMRLDPAHALGFYMSSVLVLVLASGVARMLVVGILKAKILGVAPAF
jgi:hypothetical protein